AAATAREYGFDALIGDATRAEVLERVRVSEAKIVAVTLPDPGASRQVIAQTRAMAPHTPVVARARYHVYQLELVFAGAEIVVDEEREVGRRMAASIRKMVQGRDE
ncbi:MAG: NAD-binding protein, partial [Planctomycetota bacterium]